MTKTKCGQCGYEFRSSAGRCCKCANRIATRDKYRSAVGKNPQSLECKRCGVTFSADRILQQCEPCSATAEKASRRRAKNRYKAKRERQLRELSTGDKITLQLVIQKDGSLCAMCGIDTSCYEQNDRHDATVDHVIPLSRGGMHSLDNVQLLCRMCNSLKADRVPLPPGLVLSDLE